MAAEPLNGNLATCKEKGRPKPTCKYRESGRAPRVGAVSSRQEWLTNRYSQWKSPASGRPLTGPTLALIPSVSVRREGEPARQNPRSEVPFRFVLVRNMRVMRPAAFT